MLLTSWGSTASARQGQNLPPQPDVSAFPKQAGTRLQPSALTHDGLLYFQSADTHSFTKYKPSGKESNHQQKQGYKTQFQQPSQKG